MKKNLALALSAVSVLTCMAAPVVDQPVEGYQAWEGFLPKNHLWGRQLSPSDLRHRAVVYVVADYADLNYKRLAEFYSTFAGVSSLRHSPEWDSFEMPRSKITVFSVKNADKVDPKEFAAKMFTRPKESQDAWVSTVSICYYGCLTPFYRGLKPIGGEPTPDALPFVAVYGGSGTKPIFAKGGFGKDKNDVAEFRKAVAKAVKELDPPEWKKPFGVAEPQYFKNVTALIEKGKPTTAAFPLLLAGMKSKVPEQAKEAQIMYDALHQYRGELVMRLRLEARAAPARAYCDLQQLVTLFPSEKKNVEAVSNMIKSNKEITSLGKAFEKVALWSRPDYVCKNNSEVKKNIAELEKFKKVVATLAESKNTNIQGEAMILQSQIDTLIETMPDKLPQK